MSIGINDNFNVNAPKNIDDRYSVGGVTPYASVAAANAAIPITRRAIGLTVLIGGTEYWYQFGINDPDLVIKSATGAGSSLPIVRYVYLVQDAGDATLMGGVPSNVYTTFQAAYTAANALQVSLGGTNVVVIKVGNTTAATVGNLTLTAAYNTRVHITGISRFQSILGNIIGDNAAGNGFAFGSSAALRVNLTNITLGTISTRATGTTGSSGQVNLQLVDSFVSNVTTNPTNAGNLTGVGGNFNVTGTGYTVGNVTTSATPGVNVAAGSVVAVSLGNPGQLGSVQTANGNTGGGVTISNLSSVGGITVSQSATATANVILTNITTVSGLSLNLNDARTLTINKCTTGTISVNNIGAAITPITVNIIESVIGDYTQGDWPFANVFMRNSTCTGGMALLSRFSQIYDSTIQGCIFDIEQQNLSPFEAIRIKNCVLVGDPALGATYSMDNTSSGLAYGAYFESYNNTFVRSTTGVIHTENAPIGTGGIIDTLPGSPNFVWDTSLYDVAKLDILGGGATNYTLDWVPARWFNIGKKFTLWIRSGNNTGTFTFTFFGSGVIFPGGTPWTPSVGLPRLDRLEFQADGSGIIMCTPTLDYK